MTTKQIETTKTALANLNCDTDAVYYSCPRGFANETGLLPIPTAFRPEAEELARRLDDVDGGAARILPIENLSNSQMLIVWGFGNEGNGADLLSDEWAMLTWKN